MLVFLIFCVEHILCFNLDNEYVSSLNTNQPDSASSFGTEIEFHKLSSDST